jgi:uncharacterized protein
MEYGTPYSKFHIPYSSSLIHMTPDQQATIQIIADEVKAQLAGEGSGHDWWHIYRVWNTAKRIGDQEGADAFIVELAALLHDIADWKFHDGDETVGPKMARQMLEKHSVDAGVTDRVCNIIRGMSFKGAGVSTRMESMEGKVVQDADRLDAIGAIGIARAFAYGGHANRPLYDPDYKPVMHQTKEEYLKSGGSTVSHFYEKLLLLKDRMNTASAKGIAAGRHRFLEAYLDRFYQEWEGKE